MKSKTGATDKLKNFEFTIFFTVIGLFLLGIVLLMSATHLNDLKRIIIQFATFLIGFGFLAATSLFDYMRIKKYHRYIYGLCIFLLLLVWIPGIRRPQFGAYSWVSMFGVFNLQTSEIVKPLFILLYAAYLEDKKGKISEMGDLVKALLFPVPILLLIFIQPDLGGTIVFLCIMFGMLFVAGLDIKLILLGFTSFILSFPLIYKFALKPHQVKRLNDYVNILLNPSDLSTLYTENLQVIQSITAIGSGGVFGKGWMKGTYSQYGFIPVASSDFLFSVAGEEFGFIGMSIILLLFFIFLIRILRIAVLSKDFYGTLICIGSFSMFFYQVVQNIGMTIGIIPVTGLTLPFVSYGGSSMISAMMTVSLVLNVSKNRKQF